MTLDPQQLQRLREGFALSSPDDLPRSDCPPPEQLWAAAGGGSPPGNLRELVRHVATCPVCTESWLLALELERDSAPVAERETTRRWGQLARIAAVVIVGVGLGFLIRGDRSEDTVLRTPEAQVLALLSDEVMASRGSCRLVWTAIEGARYDVRVTLEDLEEVSRALGLELAEFRVPEADLAAVPACTPLLAHIEAYRLGAGRLAGITARFRCDSPGSDC